MKPSVLINLDRPRNIRLNTNAMVKMEEVLNKPLSEIGASFGVKEIRAVVWAGLLHEDKTLTLESVGDLLDDADLTYVAKKIGEAMQIAKGKPAEATDPN